MNKKISAEIVADSINTVGDRITTYLLTYPRFIHAELMTHRVFSRNSASSRAIPFKRMLKMVEEDPFIPIAWVKDHSGMQGNEYFTNKDSIEQFTTTWLEASKYAAEMAEELNSSHIMDYNNPEDKRGLTKQLCNRLLEPFMWHTTLVTSTEFGNWFELRCPKYKLFGLGCGPQKSRKDWLRHMQFSSTLHPSQYPKTIEDWLLLSESGAEIHIQALAESMWDAMNESKPKELKPGEWHIPLFNNHTVEKLDLEILPKTFTVDEFLLKISTARCARLSYLNHDGEIDYEKDIQLHDKLLLDKHMSPFEHCARAMTSNEYHSLFKGEMNVCDEDEYNIYSDTSKENSGFGWCNNFKGFIQYRYLIENNLI